LQGIVIFDRLQRDLPADPFLNMITWRKREIENYICTPETLLAWATADGIPEREIDLVEQASSPGRREAMQRAIDEVSDALSKLGKPSPWQGDLKVSEEFLEPVFSAYHRHLGLPETLMRKKQFYELADFLPESQFDAEITEKLDAIWNVAQAATEQNSFETSDQAQ
jgi:hypothetical protein